jgi:hypothetical protein
VHLDDLVQRGAVLHRMKPVTNVTKF